MRGVCGLLAFVLVSMLAQELACQESQASLYKQIAKPIGRMFGVKTLKKATSLSEPDYYPDDLPEIEVNSESDPKDSLALPKGPKFDFRSMCFRNHKPNFIKTPVLHFFSAQEHSETTRVCGQNLAIKLKPTNGRLSLKPKLDEAQIKEQLIESNLFNSSVETYIITHGFLMTWKTDKWMCDLKDLILDKSHANVFILDWSGGSRVYTPLAYGTAVGNSRYVGALLGEFIRLLVEISGQKDASQYHVIGHSLGAHVSGYAGYYLNGTLGRITGLDPAGPCFKARSDKIQQTALEDGYLDNGSRRLSRQSAQIVLALHTDVPLYGLRQSCGHFDVYVNGGYHQPHGRQTSLQHEDDDQDEPMSNMMHINRFLDDNVRHRHIFCYKVFKQYFTDANLPASNDLASVSVEEDNNKCYLIAYQCSNWETFKRGECGFCFDGDHECVSISPGMHGINKSSIEDNSNYDLSSTLEIDDGDDTKFNDESVLDGHPGRMAHLQGWRRKRIHNFSQGQHFLRTGTEPAICKYHYQVIVAVRRQAGQSETSQKQYYYLDIPLELSGKLTDDKGNRLEDRLVQVSHKVTVGSIAYNNIRTKYMMNSRLVMRGLIYGDELDFYTALITFEPITEPDRCRTDDMKNGAGREKKKWQICHPLSKIQEARLWSSSETNLDAFVWAGLNYMSGLNYEHRLRESHIFDRVAGVSINRMDKSIVLGDEDPTVRTKPAINRLLSLSDTCENKSKKSIKFKSTRSNKEMIYAIDLRSSKLGSRV